MFRRNCPPIPLPGMTCSDVMPPVMHQPLDYVKCNQFNHLVPHIHPINETIVNSHLFHNQHFFPHTYKVIENVAQMQEYYGTPFPR